MDAFIDLTALNSSLLPISYFSKVEYSMFPYILTRCLKESNSRVRGAICKGSCLWWCTCPYVLPNIFDLVYY